MKNVITISRQLGSQGSYIAAAIAQKLNLRYLDREILHRAAEMAGYPDAEMVEQLEDHERMPGVLRRMLATLETLPPVPAVPSATLREGYVYDEVVAMMMQRENMDREQALLQLAAQQQRAELASSYADLVRQVILECAQAGNVIIVGRGGQAILRDMSGVLRVKIVGSEEIRARRLMQRLGIDAKEAERQIRRSDRERARYLKHFHGLDWEDPRLYDLVLNTDRLTVDAAVQLIIEAAQYMAQPLP
ncbi:MAG: cytidylate kinase-like family protein [Chloroflexi bacterium]|nr:cytidylate kinase-like family protein [Chloroflexota bacterium]OQA99832.1 MAG: cytidylate kinase [Chloroflexi bacterium ADurb.Bin222]HOC20118.1 cytidylate kinase-like family protein [Anaerolineae bacterium]HOS79080.1 cytidylate kinase-like family protein [Anaerolineae bacterium]HQM13163.1 cytidylate kinase-like family protein [Anaerolineae bacterium]